MKKALILASMAVLALVSCEKKEFAGTEKLNEMSFVAMAGDDLASRGYTTGSTFTYGPKENPTAESGYRTMQISAYLYPQNGAAGNYFVGNTFETTNGTIWANFVGGIHTPIYWPVGSTMDFLAFSLSEEKNVSIAWDQANAASKVTLGVPAENTQNDILFSSKAGVESKSSDAAVPMTFDHAQAWLQFKLSTNIETAGVVKLSRIVLEDVYTAGNLVITNNGGNAIAEWNFAEQPKDVAVDNINGIVGLTPAPQQLNMLVPQQPKTAFVIYYTLNGGKELSYRFPTDLKTWLMGEKYIYNIKINTAEITVAPSVTGWNDNTEVYDL